MDDRDVGGSGDCAILNAIWKMIWDPTGPFYLPTVAKNGLDIAALGLNIPPFDTYHIPSIPPVTMFDEPVLGYMKIELSDSTVEGISTVSGTNLSCDDRSSGDTKFSFDFAFSDLNLSGHYRVDAGGGIGGCAIAATAAILGGSAMDEMASGTLAAPAAGAAGSELALWYQDPLGKSSNGQALIGAYYEHQDSILDLQSEGGGQNAYVQSLSASDVHSTKTSVYNATDFYRNQQNAAADAQGAAPTIGSDEQYNAGQLPYAYLIAMARRKVSSGQDPDGRFAKLAADATHFIGSITWYKTTFPGEQPIGGQDGVLDRIAGADPDEIIAFTAGKSASAFLNEATLAAIDEPTRAHLDVCVVEEPDIDRWHAAYRRKMELTASTPSNVDGSYKDENINISGSIEGTLKTVDGNLTLSITDIQATVNSVHINLDQTRGWWPGLYNKVVNWLSNDTFIHGEIKKGIAKGLTSEEMKKTFEGALNGALKSL